MDVIPRVLGLRAQYDYTHMPFIYPTSCKGDFKLYVNSVCHFGIWNGLRGKVSILLILKSCFGYYYYLCQ